MNEQCDRAIRKILEQQLYKEDITIDYICCNDCEEEILSDEIDFNKKIKSEFGHGFNCENSLLEHEDLKIHCIIDTSIYDKFPSKDVK